MFTGLVQAVGRIASMVVTDGAARIAVDPGKWTHVPAHGDSIAVAGVCLTVVNHPGPTERLLAFDAIPQTLARTRLGTLRPGDRVNLEHAATMSTLLGGHLVQGHIDGVGRVRAVQRGSDWRVEIELPRAGATDDLTEYVAERGSICVDGVSLTVADAWASPGGIAGFTVALIPTTLELTTLADLKADDPVNIEVDALAKFVVNTARRYLRSVDQRRSVPER
jgi:riboflavin synthase